MALPLLFAAPATQSPDGTRVLFIGALLLGALWFIFEFFKREIGGLGGGSEKNIVGVIVLVAAIVVGVLLGAGGKSADNGHHKTHGAEITRR